MLLILSLCHNSFSSFRRLLKYIKYRITGGVSIENPNLLELCALKRKFQRRVSLCDVQGFQKYLLCVVYLALCIRRSRLKTTEKYEDDTDKATAVAKPFQACKRTPRPLRLLSLCCAQ